MGKNSSHFPITNNTMNIKIRDISRTKHENIQKPFYRQARFKFIF